jgi:predicted transcriptional regulator
MNSATTKEMRKEVKKYVDKADDKVVKIFYAMMEAEQEDDWWDKLPKKVQAEIDEALADLDKGNGIPHEEVMKKYSKWFPK